MSGEQMMLDIGIGGRLRDEGIGRAHLRAADWAERAIHDLVQFLRHRGEATIEEWRMDWIRRQMPAPSSHKAYGALTQLAARRGLIQNTGRYVKASSIKTHCHPVPIWRPA